MPTPQSQPPQQPAFLASSTTASAAAPKTAPMAAANEADPLEWVASLEGVRSAMVGARDGIDALLRDRGLRRTSPEQTTESLFLGAHASASLAGSTTTTDDLAAGHGDEISQAALRVSTEVLGLAPTLAHAPAQVLARLHAVAASDQSPELAGRVRNDSDARRMQQLCTTIRSTRVPALITAALAHAEIITVAPFASHNGIVARAVERLILVQAGIDPPSITVPEAGHLGLRAEYESNLRGYASGTQAGLHSWMLYAAEAFTLGAERSPLARK